MALATSNSGLPTASATSAAAAGVGGKALVAWLMGGALGGARVGALDPEGGGTAHRREAAGSPAADEASGATAGVGGGALVVARVGHALGVARVGTLNLEGARGRVGYALGVARVGALDLEGARGRAAERGGSFGVKSGVTLDLQGRGTRVAEGGAMQLAEGLLAGGAVPAAAGASGLRNVAESDGCFGVSQGLAHFAADGVPANVDSPGGAAATDERSGAVQAPVAAADGVPAAATSADGASAAVNDGHRDSSWTPAGAANSVPAAVDGGEAAVASDRGSGLVQASMAGSKPSGSSTVPLDAEAEPACGRVGVVQVPVADNEPSAASAALLGALVEPADARWGVIKARAADSEPSASSAALPTDSREAAAAGDGGSGVDQAPTAGRGRSPVDTLAGPDSVTPSDTSPTAESAAAVDGLLGDVQAPAAGSEVSDVSASARADSGVPGDVGSATEASSHGMRKLSVSAAAWGRDFDAALKASQAAASAAAVYETQEDSSTEGSSRAVVDAEAASSEEEGEDVEISGPLDAARAEARRARESLIKRSAADKQLEVRPGGGSRGGTWGELRGLRARKRTEAKARAEGLTLEDYTFGAGSGRQRPFLVGLEAAAAATMPALVNSNLPYQSPKLSPSPSPTSSAPALSLARAEALAAAAGPRLPVDPVGSGSVGSGATTGGPAGWAQPRDTNAELLEAAAAAMAAAAVAVRLAPGLPATASLVRDAAAIARAAAGAKTYPASPAAASLVRDAAAVARAAAGADPYPVGAVSYVKPGSSAAAGSAAADPAPGAWVGAEGPAALAIRRRAALDKKRKRQVSRLGLGHTSTP